MEQGTGVSASEWQKIINRESGGSTTAANPSGAFGLFQSKHNPGSTGRRWTGGCGGYGVAAASA